MRTRALRPRQRKDIRQCVSLMTRSLRPSPRPGTHEMWQNLAGECCLRDPWKLLRKFAAKIQIPCHGSALYVRLANMYRGFFLVIMLWNFTPLTLIPRCLQVIHGSNLQSHLRVSNTTCFRKPIWHNCKCRQRVRELRLRRRHNLRHFQELR